MRSRREGRRGISATLGHDIISVISAWLGGPRRSTISPWPAISLLRHRFFTVPCPRYTCICIFLCVSFFFFFFLKKQKKKKNVFSRVRCCRKEKKFWMWIRNWATSYGRKNFFLVCVGGGENIRCERARKWLKYDSKSVWGAKEGTRKRLGLPRFPFSISLTLCLFLFVCQKYPL